MTSETCCLRVFHLPLPVFALSINCSIVASYITRADNRLFPEVKYMPYQCRRASLGCVDHHLI